ncbi:hypothetical protein M2419_002311 [Sphingobacterium sp. BIGb0116]|nr:hypothetical protein [Sphingobacterium sp. BIGb0116]
MALYKLKAPRQFGDMPKGYEFQVVSATIPTLMRRMLKKK